MGSFLFATLYPWILNLVLNKSKSTRLTSHFAPKAASESPIIIFFANTFLKIYTKNFQIITSLVNIAARNADGIVKIADIVDVAVIGA